MQATIDFDIKTAALARDNGIERAMKSAEKQCPEWSERAYNCLLAFIRHHGTGHRFMTEDFREWCADRLPSPPSLRAFGGVIVRAKKAGIITWWGIDFVKNVKAHKTPASVWIIK